MERLETLHFNKHQCYNCKKFFLFEHALKEHTRNHSCNSLKFLGELPVTKEFNLKTTSEKSDTLEPQCDQILTNGLNAPDKNRVLSRDSNRINIFEIFSSVINPEENCSDFEDHISLDHLKNFISSPKTINRAKKKNQEYKTGTKSSKTNHSSDELLAYSTNQNGIVKTDSKSTQTLLKLKEKQTELKSSQIKNLKLKIITSKKAQLQNNKLSNQAGQVIINGDTFTNTFTNDKKKSLTVHADLAQHCESPLVVRGTIKRTREEQYINSSCSEVLVNNSQIRILENCDRTNSSDTESATSDIDSDYDKSIDKIPPQLIYINGRTYFNDQIAFVKKKVPQGKLNSSSFTQNSAGSVEASTRAQAERTDSSNVHGSSKHGRGTKYLATKSSWKYYKKLRSQKKKKKFADLEVKTQEQTRKKEKQQFKKQTAISREKNKRIIVHNGVPKFTKSTERKKDSSAKSSSKETTDEDELLKKNVKAVILEVMQNSKVKKNYNPYKDIGGVQKENTFNQKSLHEESSPRSKECLPKSKNTITNSSTSCSAAKKNTDAIEKLPKGQQINNGKASRSDFSSCHLCNIHCEDKTESQTSLNLPKEHVPYGYICVICGNSFFFKDSLKRHMETCHQLCSSQDNWSKEGAPQICKKHQQIIEIIDLALRSMLEPFQNKTDALNRKRKFLDSNRENVVGCSPDTCIIVEDEDSEPHCDNTDLETSYIDLLKPYMRIYSDAELLSLSSDDF